MRVFVPTAARLSRAMTRVEDALRAHTRHSLATRGTADVVFIHVIGYPETVEEVEKVRAKGQKYILVQYCLRSTQEPGTLNWLPLWRDALCVWSYYDLARACLDDGIDPEFNFYLAPLGVDATVFKPQRRTKRWSVLTSGYVAESEACYEVADAAASLGKKLVHLGPRLEKHSSDVTTMLGIEDADLARTYSECEFVVGLRRVEGFELPAAEGLLCGAQPILFDKPHYRIWHEPWAKFIPEGSYEEVRDHVAAILANGPVNVTGFLPAARELFDWSRIVDGLWRRV